MSPSEPIANPKAPRDADLAEILVRHSVLEAEREEGGMASVREAAGKAPASAIFTRSQLEALRERLR